MRPDAAMVLDDDAAKKSLVRYFAVVKDERPAKFLIAKTLSAEFNHDDSTATLWKKHARLTLKFCSAEKEIDAKGKDIESVESPEKSYLDLKIELARRILHDCCFCTRKCGANRLDGKVGYCRCGSEISVSSIFEHVGEEPELVPSGTIFTMGCTMRCRHCQNWTISQWTEKGATYTPEGLAKEVEDLRHGGCRNANLVGGEPTPWLHEWFRTFKHVGANVPIVWNSNTYYSPETAQLLAGFADVYLLDFKYGPADCAERISDAPNYWDVCTRNHLEAGRHGELIIRLLILPGHVECCTRPIIEWIARNLGTETRVNVMFQYRPEWRAHEIPELGRRLTEEEMSRAIRMAREAGLTNFIT